MHQSSLPYKIQVIKLGIFKTPLNAYYSNDLDIFIKKILPCVYLWVTVYIFFPKNLDDREIILNVMAYPVEA